MGAHVLIVDDNPINRRLTERLVERRGGAVTVVENGLQAIAAIAMTPFDLVLMDCNMPVLDGWEATRRIRSDEAARDVGRTPIVAVTAQVLPGDRERCIQAGMDDYVTKPLSSEAIGSLMSRFTDAVAPEPASSAPNDEIDAARFDELRRDFGPDDVVALVQELLSSTPRLLEDLQDATAAGDLPSMRSAVHRLRGGCLVVGLRRVAAAAASVEADIDADRAEAATAGVSVVLARWASGADALRARAGI